VQQAAKVQSVLNLKALQRDRRSACSAAPTRSSNKTGWPLLHCICLFLAHHDRTKAGDRQRSDELRIRVRRQHPRVATSRTGGASSVVSAGHGSPYEKQLREAMAKERSASSLSSAPSGCRTCGRRQGPSFAGNREGQAGRQTIQNPTPRKMSKIGNSAQNALDIQ